MTIRIKQSDFDTIKKQGEETFPHECCGFLLGTNENGVKTTAELRPAINEREEQAQKNRFLITAENYRSTEKYGKEKNLEIVGFYHSHPNAPARPSQYDIDHAWPCFSYVIISIINGQADNMTSWELRDDRSDFDSEEIEINNQ